MEPGEREPLLGGATWHQSGIMDPNRPITSQPATNRTTLYLMALRVFSYSSVPQVLHRERSLCAAYVGEEGPHRRCMFVRMSPPSSRTHQGSLNLRTPHSHLFFCARIAGLCPVFLGWSHAYFCAHIVKTSSLTLVKCDV